MIWPRHRPQLSESIFQRAEKNVRNCLTAIDFKRHHPMNKSGGRGAVQD